MVFNLDKKTKAYYALLGLSEEDSFDHQLERSICMKLTRIEAEAILTLEYEDTKEEDLFDEAGFYFANTENLYYRNSRWSEFSTLHKINVKTALAECRKRTCVA